MSLVRRILAAVSGAALLTFSLAALPSPAAAALPTAAVAMGDSFISGEGAGAYNPVVDVSGTARAFPGWSAPNTDAFFCHRSANASLQRATLAGIQDRFNLACSGAQPQDLANPAQQRPKGRAVAAQLDQLRAVAQTHDIDLVLIGLGSNNTQFTFGDAASECANRFIADAWTGWWEFWAYINGPVEQEPCTADDLATAAQIAAATEETKAAVRRPADHSGRRSTPTASTASCSRTTPTRSRRTSCRASTKRKTAPTTATSSGPWAPNATGPAARSTARACRPAERSPQRWAAWCQACTRRCGPNSPAADLVYLNVQQAFDGARLCESARTRRRPWPPRSACRTARPASS